MKLGVPGSFAGQNWTAAGQAQYDNGCTKPKPDPMLPKVDHKDETGQPNCTDKTVTTTFYVRSTPYVFDEASWTWILGPLGSWDIDHTTSRAATPQECPTTVTPVAPGVTDITECGTDGQVVLPTTEGVTYAFDPAGGSPTQGPWKVTATPKTGFVIADGASTSWNGNLGTHTECPVVVLPVAPSVSEITKCGEDGLVVLPSTEGVTYAFDPAGDSPTEGPWKVTATPKTGFVFADGASTSWNGNLGAHTTCATPVAPSVTHITSCGEDGNVVLPTTEGVTYAFDPAGDSPTEGPWKVVATAKPGFSFADGTTTSWNGNLGTHTECPIEVTPVAPSVTVIEKCGEFGNVVLPTTEGVTYAFDPAGDSPTEGPWKVVATAKSGFVIADGASTSWNGNLGTHTTCATPVAPSVTDITSCGEDGNVVLPTTEGVTYAFDPAGDSPTEGPWKVTATAKEGFTFPADTQASWSGDLGDRIECVTPEPPIVDQICEEVGAVTLPTTIGVTYAFTVGDGQSGTWTIKATPNEGFGFPDGAVTEWQGVVPPIEGCVGGAQAVLPEVIGVDLCGAGVVPFPIEVEGVIYTFTLGDGTTGPWEITATAEEGYELVGPTVFSGDAGAEVGCVGGVSLDLEDDALLPDTGGPQLGLLLLGGLLTSAGVAVLVGVGRRATA